MTFLHKAEHRLHPQIRQLMQEEAGATTPEAAILARARNRIRFAEHLGWEGPPYDMEQLASLLGLRVEYVDTLPFEQSGAVVNGSPIRILIAASDPPVRQRYTIAHEVAHTLLPDPFAQFDSIGWKYRLDAQSPIEVLCQLAASEFLMPTSAVQSLPKCTSLFDLMMTIRLRFNISYEAAARRAIGLATQSAAGLVIKHMNKPSEWSDELQASLFDGLYSGHAAKLRVLYAFSSPYGPFVPAYKSIPGTSRVYELLTADRGDSIRAVEDWVGCFGWKQTLVEAVRLARPDAEFESLCLIYRSKF